ncbi:MAG: periplasmic heavy metal sensor [Alphaproteobacteria bacterium]
MSSSLRTLLFISLLLNLLAAGIFFGHLSGTLLTPARANRRRRSRAALPPERRAAFHEALVQAQEKAAPLRTKIEELRGASLCVLGSEKFDREGYVKDVAELHRLRGELIRLQVNELNDHDAFTPQERIAFMDLLRPAPAPPLGTPCQKEPR